MAMPWTNGTPLTRQGTNQKQLFKKKAIVRSSAVVSVDGAVHAAFRILDKIFGTRKMRSKTYINPTKKMCQLAWTLDWFGSAYMKWFNKKLTEFVHLSSNISSNVGWYLSDIGKWWVNQPFAIVLLRHLSCQSFRCHEKPRTVELVLHSKVVKWNMAL